MYGFTSTGYDRRYRLRIARRRELSAEISRQEGNTGNEKARTARGGKVRSDPRALSAVRW